MAGSGGLAQQVAEKLADLIQVTDKIHGFFTPSQFFFVFNGLGCGKTFLCHFRVKFTPVAVRKVPLGALEVGGWLGVR